MIVLLFVTIAAAVEPVIEHVESGRIDWTAMHLIVTVRSDRTVGAWKDRRVQEQDALDRLQPTLFDVAAHVRVRPNILVSDLLQPDPDGDITLAQKLDDGRKIWRVLETRYLSSGGVEMDGLLDLHHWLRPAMLAIATGQPQPPTPSGPTGLLIDARPTSFRPCLAPEIRSADGAVLYDARQVQADALGVNSPAVYVIDPIDPMASDRAGSEPVFLSAESSESDCILILSSLDSARLADNPAIPGLFSAGKLVIVVQM